MKRVAITAMVCASEGDLCYHLHNAARPMTDPKNTEDQELSLDQLKDAAGGLTAARHEKAAGDKLGRIFTGSSDSSKFVGPAGETHGAGVVGPTDEPHGGKLLTTIDYPADTEN